MYKLEYAIKRTIDGVEREIILNYDEISSIYFYFEWNCKLNSAWDLLREKYNLSDDDQQHFDEVVNEIAHSYTKTCGYIRDEEHSWAWDKAFSECSYEIEKLTGVNEDDE